MIGTVAGGEAASPEGRDSPLNVTSAFSDTQVRFAELKRASTTEEESGMLKLVCAAEIRRGMESPRVTSGVEEMVAVVQPVVPLMVQVGPVKPFMHMQEQVPVEKTEVPPFWHAVLGSAAHRWADPDEVE